MSTDQTVEHLEELRERYGFSYIQIFEAQLENFAPVIDPVTSTIYVVVKTKEPGPVYVQRVHALDLKLDSASSANFRHGLLDSHQSRIASDKLGVAQINFQPRPARHTVHRAGFDSKNAGRADRVRAAGIQSRLLDR